MSIWLILWLVLSGTLIWFLLWTLYILYRQKEAWRNFAKRHKLRYRSGALMASPEVSGVYRGYTINLFTAEHITNDPNASRKLSALEITLNEAVPLSAAVGSGGMVQLIQGLDFNDEYRPPYEFWDTAYIVRTRDKAMVKEYLSEERARALVSLMTMKNAWMIFICTGDESLLRIDTPDPLNDLAKLEKTVRKVLGVAEALELKPGEKRRILAQKNKKLPAENVLEAEDVVIPEKPAFELEDEAASGEDEGNPEQD